jgi:mycolipenoyl-CoA---2-(long-chain-fatty acyl)-trehalose mycolipenoyltransferase / long-chain-acyl-CoA---trehalose acyltransferase
LAEYDLTGNRTYHGFTPYDTRKPGTDTLTVGWFASLVPIAVPLGTGSFAEAARAAQNSFDSSKHLADVPFDRVLELATPDELGIGPDTRPATMVSFLDFRKIPVIALWEATNFGAYGDNLSHGGINMWVNRHADKTTVTISFPDNPVAQASVLRYAAALTESFARVVRPAVPELKALQTNAIRANQSLTAA